MKLGDQTRGGWWVIRSNFLCLGEKTIVLLLLALLCVPWMREIAKGEVNPLSDEASHIINGVFVLDFMRDLPLSWPMQYAREYYAKYPSVSIGHWPPAFYLVEAVFFAIFGFSIWVSRLAVLPFALAGAVFLYKIVRYYARPELAFASAVIYTCLPAVLILEKSTMLEIPTLALSLGAVYFWLVLLRTERPGYLYAAALLSAWALLTKQTAVFLIPFFVLHLIVERKWFLLKWKHTYLASAGVLCLLVPWQVLVLSMQPGAVTRGLPAMGQRAGIPLTTVLAYYPLTLPEQLGILLLVLGGLGIVAGVLRREYAALRFFLTLGFACYLTFTPLAERSPRYTMAWLLVFVYFAVYFVWWIFSRWPRLGMAALAGLAASYYVVALSHQRPYVEGFEHAASYLAQQADSDLIFYKGVLHRDFIPFVRKFDPEKRRLVVRDKSIVSASVHATDGNHPNPLTPGDIEDRLLRLGVRYIVVEKVEDGPLKKGIEGVEKIFGRQNFMLDLTLTLQALQSDNFELVKEIPVISNSYEKAEITLLIYRTTAPPLLEGDEITLPMRSLAYDIQLPLSRLVGQPWPPPR